MVHTSAMFVVNIILRGNANKLNSLLIMYDLQTKIVKLKAWLLSFDTLGVKSNWQGVREGTMDRIFNF